YLGNTTAPLQVLKISKDLKEIQSIKITPEESSFHFRSLQLKVIPPYFYLADGTVPCIYGGKTTDWKAKLKLEGAPYFTLIESMDSINFVFRSNSLRSGENIIGILKLSHPPQFKLTDQLLQKQNKKDGIFDTDGTLLVDKESTKIIYLYRYRNQFIVADKNADLLYRGNTIDTISQARIQVSEVNGERTMSKPPLSVNTDAAVYKNLLFVNSMLRGKYDNKKAWEMSSTIDVYDLVKRKYLFSFYIPAFNTKKISGVIVTDKKIYVLAGTKLILYETKGVLEHKLNE